MRKDKANRLVNFAINELQRIAPANAEIKVDVKERDGHFVAQLKVHANHKIFFAKKIGDDMYDSFHKAMKAMKAQLIKEKKILKAHDPLKFMGA
jgi:ribosome-associated translation inhibitor RaiA